MEKDFIRAIYPFNHLSDMCFESLLSCLRYEKLEGGDLLAKQGEFGDKLYILLEGRLYFLGAEKDDDKIMEGYYPPGSVIGEFALLGNIPRTASIYALRDSLVASLSREDFLHIQQKHPEILRYLAEMAFKKITTPPGEYIKAKLEVKTIAFIPTEGKGTFTEQIQFLRDYLYEKKNCLFLDSINYPAKTNCKGIGDSLRSWLNHSEMNYKHIFYWADTALSAWTELCIRQADSIILLVRGDEDNYALTEVEEHINRCYVTIPKKKTLALFHESHVQCPRNTGRWISLRKSYDYLHLRRHKRDFDRLLRVVTGKALALVLGGGGARAVAHIGLLKYFEEQKIDIDFIGGCSMGGIIASWYAMGFRYADILEIGRNYQKQTTKLDYTFPYLSLTRGKNIYDNLRDFYGEMKIEDMWVNFFCNSTDLRNGDIFIHQEGYLWKAIRATISLPIVFPPVSFGHALMIDGGISNNIPVSQMKALSHHAHTIASYISGEAKLPHFKYPDYVSGFSLLYQRLRRVAGKPPSLNMLELIIRLISLSSMNENKKMLEIADAVIDLNMENFGLLDFDKYEEIIEAGYQMAKNQMESLALQQTLG